MLVILHSFPGASIENISQALDLSHSNLVRVVEQLRQMSLLEKKPGKDARSNALFITPAGETILTDFYDQRDAQMQAVLSAPSIDVDKFAAAQAHARAVSASGRKIIDDNVLTMLRALPPADRRAFLTALAQPQVAGTPGPRR